LASNAKLTIGTITYTTLEVSQSSNAPIILTQSNPSTCNTNHLEIYVTDRGLIRSYKIGESSSVSTQAEVATLPTLPKALISKFLQPALLLAHSLSTDD